MKLHPGERYELNKEDAFLRVVSGSLEVYAVICDKQEFKQGLLMTLKPGEAAFPAFDEFGWIKISVYALEETELEEAKLEAVSAAELHPLMTDWFCRLVRLPWLRLLADRGDDTLKSWQKGTALAGRETDSRALLAAFEENAHIFAALQGVRFRSEDKQLQRRIERRERQKERLIDASIGELLGEDLPFYEEAGEGTAGSQMEEAGFILENVQKALSMPTTHFSLPQEIVKKLDQVGLLRRLAQKGNMQLRLVKLTGEWYKKDTGVLIGYYCKEDGERIMAALLPERPGRYRFVSKDCPGGVPLTAEIAKKLDQDAFQCYPGFPRRKLKVMDLISFMFKSCWREDYRTIILVSFFAGFIPLVTPIITETIFRDIIPIMDRKGLVTVTQVMMVTSFTLAALSIIRSIAVLRITSRLNMNVEAALWGRLLSLPEKFFRRFTTGELASRMGAMDAVKNVVSGNFVSAVFGTIFSFWSLFLMCWYSLKLTAAAVGVWLVWCLVTAFIYRRVIGFQRKLIAASNEQAGLVQQIFAGLAKFRIHGAESQAFHLWSKVFGESWRWNLALRWQGNYNTIIASVQPFVLTMLLYYIAIYGLQDTALAKAGAAAGGAAAKAGPVGISYAEFLAFEAAYTSFNGTLNSVIPLVGQFFTIQPHIENLRPLLEEVPETTDDKAEAEVLTGAMEVSHLTFSYGEDKPDVLKDVSFTVAPGENLAIVGRSGCGKSTLVRLLLGFEQPKSGAIYYDGQSLADLSLSSVRSQLGVVLQNGQLMTGDIFTNIVGQAALTQDDAWAAAEAAGIADDIRAMPMGMQTMVSEGSTNISGGQRQRIMIARALAMKPAILVFDEATSALDNRAQAIVTESLDKLSVTRLVIAHRLSTIRNCDRILVMDKGTIAESGTFQELVDKGGLFAQLVRRQVA